MIWKSLVFVFLAVGVWAEHEIPEEQRNQLKSLLSAYCKKNGADDKTVGEVEAAVNNFITCTKQLINPEQIKKEIEEAKPKGALDEVFKEYCAKSPQMKTCLHTAFNGIAPCLNENIKEYLPNVINGSEKLLDFICYKDGDRIALFIAENGPECFQDKANAIRDCFMKIKEDVGNMDAAKKLTMSEQCIKFDEMTTCIVNKLETCSVSTPGNMAEALFKFVRKSSPCQTL